MGGFNQQSVNSNGGVAWAKEVAATMDTSALDDQIQGYQQAAAQLQQVQATLQNVKNNLASSWAGDAADQAQGSFQSSIDQAVQAHDTIQAVVPPLQNAKAAQVEFVNTMQSIQGEKSVPSNSLSDEASHYFFGTPLPSQVAETHNATVRTETANALNKLSSSYEQSASEMNLATSGGPTDPGTGGGTYTPPVVTGGSGDGSASGYSENVGGGETFKAGYVATPGSGSTTTSTIGNPPPGTVTSSSTQTPVPVPVPTETDPFPVENEPGSDTPVGGGAGLITDEPIESGGGESTLGGPVEEEGGSGFNSKAGVFDENGFSDGELTGGRGTGTRVGSMSGDAENERYGSRGGVFGEGEGESSESMGGMGGRGGMGGGSEDEELSSSKYSRGRYFDGDLEESERSSLSPVRSAFENATDSDGNKVDMMGGRRGAAGEEEEEERGKRPKYLTEDEFWGNAQRVVPPVIQ
ncbi:hypothetical protein KDL01_26655 [Actinospica durhamensis]|uniref:WXG100 family type VII secretion target n=1 Tax=Actinospica durhamensis TaxID=1508375 RepID=A0A941EUZ9_9ACTN|nr:hypothetical protein [Actinospica durhamensis]MBR7836887.1 hypothetical protein [Actinospica durhamensis]